MNSVHVIVMPLSDKIRAFPLKPGVYLFKSAKGEVLYVGKAKNLRLRVGSYFVSGRDERPQVSFLLRRTRDIDFIVTDTEKEALLLENTLIKQYHPRYNLNLRDDKSYVSIKITANHPFPGIALTRRPKKDGAIYFGPYSSAAAAREAIENITRYSRVRSCSDTEFANRIRPCLKHDIGRCTAPCVGLVSEEEYARQVDEAKMFLKGQRSEILELLKAKMKKASDKMQYEEAARLRDVISMLHVLIEKQKVVRHGGGDIDAIGVSRLGPKACLCVLKVRKGILIDKRVFELGLSHQGDEELIEDFVLMYYSKGVDIPEIVVTDLHLRTSKAISEILSERCDHRVKIRAPTKGEMRRLTQLAKTNAREVLSQRISGSGSLSALEGIGKVLGLGNPPQVIECVDISNLGGREAVGSLVTFVGGEPDKSQYRLYNIRLFTTPDDYGMMKEVLERRFAALNRPLPDFLLVDGGKGQLAVAGRVIDEAGLHIPLAAIAKGEKNGQGEKVFIPGRKNPIKLRRGSPALLLLMRIRDEAHRFGISAHRRKRGKILVS